MREVRVHGGRPPPGTVDFSTPMNPLPHPPVFDSLIRDCINRGVYRGYHDPGMSEVREALGELAGADGYDIVVLNGSAGILALLPLVYRPSTVVVLEPGFGDHGIQSSVWPSRLARVMLKPRHGLLYVDEERLLDAASRGRPLIIASNPNNPLGQPLAPETLRLLEDAAEDAGGALVVDEAFQPLSSLEPYRPRGDTAYRLWTPTKALALPGLRAGALIGSGDLVGAVERGRQPWPLDSVTYCFYTRLAREALDEARRYIAEGRARILEWAPIQAGLLNSIPGVRALPTVTAFMLLEHPGLCHPRLNTELAARGVYVRDASSFHGLSCMHSRVSVASPRRATLLAQALREAAGSWG